MDATFSNSSVGLDIFTYLESDALPATPQTGESIEGFVDCREIFNSSNNVSNNNEELPRAIENLMGSEPVFNFTDSRITVSQEDDSSTNQVDQELLNVILNQLLERNGILTKQPTIFNTEVPAQKLELHDKEPTIRVGVKFRSAKWPFPLVLSKFDGSTVQIAQAIVLLALEDDRIISKIKTIPELEQYDQMVIGGLKGLNEKKLEGKGLQVALRIKENIANDIFANDTKSQRKVTGTKCRLLVRLYSFDSLENLMYVAQFKTSPFKLVSNNSKEECRQVGERPSTVKRSRGTRIAKERPKKVQAVSNSAIS